MPATPDAAPGAPGASPDPDDGDRRTARRPGPAADGQAALDERVAGAGLHRIVLPAANEMGTVNAWLIEDDPLTLVDAGTRAPGALDALEAALRARGRRVAEIGLVLLTHHHADHIGLVAEVVRRSGAEVAALAPVAPYLADYVAHSAHDRAFSSALLRRHGADEAAIAAHEAGWAAFHDVAEPATVTVPLATGSRVTLRDRTLELLHRPGHSETDVLLVDAERRIALGGDHVLAAAPSVPVRDRPLAPPAPYSAAVDDVAVLLRYRASLRATRELPVDVVLPGHGAAFDALPGTVDRHLRRQERDAERLLARTGEQPFAAARLVDEIWPAATPPMAFVLLSTVLGSLGLLQADGRVRRLEADGVGPVRYLATGG